jgi:hypothetical protein
LTILRYLAIFGWVSIGLYFGTQGLVLLELDERYNETYESAKFDTVQVFFDGDQRMEFWYEGQKSLYLDQKSIKEVFTVSFLEFCPSFLLLILTACAFGLAGSSMSIAKKKVIDKVPIEQQDVIFTPLLGLMVGIVVLGLAETIPTILMSGTGTIRPIVLVFLSFFAGFFIENFLAWFENRFQKMLEKKK